VAPSIIWGIGVGLVIAAADAATIILAGSVDPNQWPIDDIDTLVNIALYSLIGFKVARATGIVRDAAEAGVIAGVLVGLAGLVVARAFPPPTGAMDTPNQMIAQIAWNIVFGGCLAIVAGWFGSRASKGGTPTRP
jgi:hypothetical protein